MDSMIVRLSGLAGSTGVRQLTGCIGSLPLECDHSWQQQLIAGAPEIVVSLPNPPPASYHVTVWAEDGSGRQAIAAAEVSRSPYPSIRSLDARQRIDVDGSLACEGSMCGATVFDLTLAYNSTEDTCGEDVVWTAVTQPSGEGADCQYSEIDDGAITATCAVSPSLQRLCLRWQS